MLPVNMDGSHISPEKYRAPRPPVYFFNTFQEALPFMKPGTVCTPLAEVSGYVVCPKEIEVHIPPKQHTDKDGNVISDAFYYIEQRVDGGVIYLSYLPPFGKTSKPHRHSDDMFEHYRLLKGEAEITLGYDMRKTIKIEDYLRVPYGMGHQMSAGEKGSLTLLYLENPHGVSDKNLHIRDDEILAA